MSFSQDREEEAGGAVKKTEIPRTNGLGTHREGTLPVENQPIDNRPQHINNAYPPLSMMSDAAKARKCWRVGHLAKDCPA